MMVTMNLSDSDKAMAFEFSRTLVTRRKQMCPWPLTAGETETLYIPSNLLAMRDELLARNESTKELLYYGQRLSIDLSDYPIRGKKWKVGISTNNYQSMWVPQNCSTVDACYESPHWATFQTWALTAYKVEYENLLVLNTIGRLFNVATTWKQIHKALPETLNGLLIQAGSSDARRSWSYKSNTRKLKEVAQQLRSEGSSRAKNLPDIAADMIKRRGSFVESIMAQAALLDEKTVLDDGPFQDTWVHGVTLPKEEDLL